MNVIGLDPGFASLGWGVVELTPRVVLINAGCIRTKKSQRKVLATDDNVRRIRELYRVLDPVFTQYEPRAIATESMSWPRSSSVCAKLGMSWGLSIAIAERYDLPLVSVSPMDLKTALTGDGTASKAEVRAAVLATPGFHRLAGLLDKAKFPPSQYEHPTDAVAAVLATQTTDIMRTIRQLGGTR